MFIHRKQTVRGELNFSLFSRHINLYYFCQVFSAAVSIISVICMFGNVLVLAAAGAAAGSHRKGTPLFPILSRSVATRQANVAWQLPCFIPGMVCLVVSVPELLRE
jgi:hypothetical protein